MSRRQRTLAGLAAGLIGLAGTAMGAEVRLNNLDAGTGTGLDDPTPVSPVGGNPGKTRGEQARIVFEYAASLWGAVLKSRVPITVDASFKRLACTANGGTAGNARAVNIFIPDPGTPGVLPGVAYHAALANALEGVDSDPGQAEVLARFNGAMGTPGCAEGHGWYFGLDGRTPRDRDNFLNVVLHEMAHGLGFSDFNNLATGEVLTGDDGVVIPDIYSLYVYDNAKRKWWYDMSNAERASSAVNDGHLVFAGTRVHADAPRALGQRDALLVAAPAEIAGEYGFQRVAFGPAANASNFSGDVVRVATGSNAQGCSAPDNANAIAGHVALIELGTCKPADKVRFAQAARATGVMLIDSKGDAASMSWDAGSGDPIGIPVLVVAQSDGAVLEANLAGLRVVMQKALTGADLDGRVQLYAPSILKPASSFAHFDTRLWPDPLMRWQGTPGMRGHINLDLTPSLLQDEGWRLNTGGQLLRLCDSGVPTWIPGGWIIGANLVAQAKMLASTSATMADYAAGMRQHAKLLADSRLLTPAQASNLNACLSDAELSKQYESWRKGGSGEPALVEVDSGKLVPAQAGAAGSERLYLLTVPSGARTLSIRTFGGTGDVSLFVRVGNEPTASLYSYRSVHAGNNESVSLARPAAGAYFIKLVGVQPYANVSVQASYRM